MIFNNIIQLYGYSLFDNIVLPAGIDKEILINNIMDKCAMYTPLYTYEDLLKMKIEQFFKKNLHTFEELYKGYIATYNPVENYDRYEEYTTDVDGVNKVSPFDNGGFVNDTSNQNKTHNVGRVHGNIGVTTAPAMLNEHINIQKKLNIYDVIAVEFFKEFVLYISD